MHAQTAERPKPAELVNRLVAVGIGLRKIDSIGNEGAANPKPAKRSDNKFSARRLSESYAAKYLEDIKQLARLPRTEVDKCVAAHLRAKSKNKETREVASVIELHLRMARAEAPPKQADVIEDFANLRYHESNPTHSSAASINADNNSGVSSDPEDRQALREDAAQRALESLVRWGLGRASPWPTPPRLHIDQKLSVETITFTIAILSMINLSHYENEVQIN
jgi:hypothetical protein